MRASSTVGKNSAANGLPTHTGESSTDPDLRWAAGELKGICQSIVSAYDLAEARRDASVSLAKEAKDKFLKRES